MNIDLSKYSQHTERVVGIMNNNKLCEIEELPSIISVATDFPAIVSCYFVKIILNTNKLDEMISNLQKFYDYGIITNEGTIKERLNELL